MSKDKLFVAWFPCVAFQTFALFVWLIWNSNINSTNGVILRMRHLFIRTTECNGDFFSSHDSGGILLISSIEISNHFSNRALNQINQLWDESHYNIWFKWKLLENKKTGKKLCTWLFHEEKSMMHCKCIIEQEINQK